MLFVAWEMMLPLQAEKNTFEFMCAVPQKPSLTEELQTRNDHIAKALITLIATGGVCLAFNELGKSVEPLHLGKDAEIAWTELEFISLCAGLLWSLKSLGIVWAGVLTKELLIAVSTIKVVNTHAFQKLVQAIPLIGKEIGCTTDQRIALRPDWIGREKVRPFLSESHFMVRRGLQTIFFNELARRMLPRAYAKVTLSLQRILRRIPTDRKLHIFRPLVFDGRQNL